MLRLWPRMAAVRMNPLLLESVRRSLPPFGELQVRMAATVLRGLLVLGREPSTYEAVGIGLNGHRSSLLDAPSPRSGIVYHWHQACARRGISCQHQIVTSVVNFSIEMLYEFAVEHYVNSLGLTRPDAVRRAHGKVYVEARGSASDAVTASFDGERIGGTSIVLGDTRYDAFEFDRATIVSSAHRTQPWTEYTVTHVEMNPT